MAVTWDVVPGGRFATGASALETMLADATVLRIAVAYVTGSGVQRLASILAATGHPGTVQVVTRATDTTASIEDLRSLETLLGAEVRAFVGSEASRFHPKLYMTRAPNSSFVLSGSGNLTLGGLENNDEQFELLQQSTGPQRPGQRAPERFESAASNDLIRRFSTYFSGAMPLANALSHPSFLSWQEQSARRADLEAELRKLDRDVESAETDAAGVAPRGTDASKNATEQMVRNRMEAWFPNAPIRRTVFLAFAQAIRIANSVNPDGWWCGYVTDSRFGGNRLTVCAALSQVFVAHSDSEVYFPAPPSEVDSTAGELCDSLELLEGVRIEPSRIGDVTYAGQTHPYVCVPASSIDDAVQRGALDLIPSIIDWRMTNGRTAHWQRHCSALVRVVARETGEELQQPSYEP
ncbi:unannotated protein [freshwater metagenome]|uniref:Unannotated protein n=1 Tax=freshwater metagenome TaxID=449393 RepID=A0A6J7H566_9ZZZZ|nr:hypothetical protein [Actinomycetota bacterium]